MAFHHGSVRRQQWLYASGNLGKSIVWTTFETILLYYLVAIAGLSPALAGATLVLSMLFDASGDLVIGYLIDRHGGIATLQRIATLFAPLCGIGFGAMFAAGLASPAWVPTLTVAACLACRACYTLCDVAHNALLVRAAPTPPDAGFVSGLRLVFSAMGAALVGGATTWLLARPIGGAQQFDFCLAAMAGGVIYAALVPRAVRTAIALPGRRAIGDRPDLRRTIAALTGDAGVRRLATIVTLQVALVPLFAKGLPFVLAQAGDPGRTGVVLFALAAAQAVTMPLWIVASRFAMPHGMLLIGHALTGLAMIALACSPAAAWIALAAIVVAGVGMAGMNLAIWALIALTVGDCAERTGLRLETVAMSLFVFVLKIAAGLATGGLALALTVGGPSVSILTLAGPVIGAVACMLLVLPQAMARKSERWRTIAFSVPTAGPVQESRRTL